MLGKYYKTHDGKMLEYMGIIDFYTEGVEERMIGNYAFKTAEGIEIVGFENHSGKTYLGKNVKPLGTVIKGYGNNGEDSTEGVRYKNTFGTYSHGPILPKNSNFADLLISLALKNKYGDVELIKLDDELELPVLDDELELPVLDDASELLPTVTPSAWPATPKVVIPKISAVPAINFSFFKRLVLSLLVNFS